MKRFLVLIILLLIFFQLEAFNPSDTLKNLPFETYLVQPATRAISVNGILNEWDGVDSIILKAPFSAPEDPHEAVVKALWDWEKIYIAFRVTDPHLNAATVENDSTVWEDDAIEVFFRLKPKLYEDSTDNCLRGSDYQFILNILNTIGTLHGNDSAMYPENNYANPKWDVDFLTGIHLSGTPNNNTDIDKGFEMEIAIYWASMNFLPHENDTLRADFCVDDRNINDSLRVFDWAGLTWFAQPKKWNKIVLSGNPKQGISKPIAPVETEKPKQRYIYFVLSGIAVLLIVIAAINVRRKKRTEGEGAGGDTLPLQPTHSQEIARKAMVILQEEYQNENLRITDVCYKLFITKRHLQRILKQEKNKTFRQLLNEIRLEKARELLEKTDISITEIAFKVGFSDHPHFTRSFKIIFNQNPFSYRKSNSKILPPAR